VARSALLHNSEVEVILKFYQALENYISQQSSSETTNHLLLRIRSTQTSLIKWAVEEAEKALRSNVIDVPWYENMRIARRNLSSKMATWSNDLFKRASGVFRDGQKKS
jgi:hypothetical protein